MREAKARVRWIDLCKLLGMILVIWLHFGCPGIIDGYAHLFHMPIFFLLSGVCLKTERSFRDFALSRVKSLLLPYLSFAVIFYAFWSVVHLTLLPERTVGPGVFLVHLFWDNTDAVTYLWGAIQWFLPCLFFAEIIFFRVAKNAGEARLLPAGICVALALAAMVFLPKLEMRLPLALDIALVAVAFVGIGYGLRDVFFRIGGMKNGRLCLLTAVAFAVTAVVFYFNRGTNMRMMVFGNPVLYLLGSTAGCVMMVCVSAAAERVLARCGGKLMDHALYLGKNTIILLYIHRLFDGLNKTVLHLAGVSFPSKILEYAYFAFMVPVFLVLSYPVTKFVDRRMWFLLGR